MTLHQKHYLMLMRHGKSDWHGGIDRDFDRPLTKRGGIDARRIARWMGDHQYIPDMIVSSPAQRTRETAMIVTAELQLDSGLIRWDDHIYEASRERLLAVTGRYSASSRCLLLIGHNPGLDSLVSWLADHEPVRTESGKLMTTSALAILARADNTTTPVEHSLPLQQIVRPQQII